MKIVLHYDEEYELNENQINLIKRLAEGDEYLHDDEANLADKTPGIYDSGEGKYSLSQRGWRILNQLNSN